MRRSVSHHLYMTVTFPFYIIRKKTMPDVMFKYRAASFFAGTFCPEKLEGIPTVEEMQDVNGYEEAPAPEKVIITLEE